MKKLVILSVLMIILSSCNEAKKEDEKIRYTQDSEEINTMKAAISDYEEADWNAMKKHYADTAQIFHNSTKAKKIGDIIKEHEESLSGLSNYEFTDEEEDYEMVLTDDGNTWVNFWGEWKGTMADSSAKEVVIPVHLTAQFKNGKIVKEHAYWDNSIMMMAAQETDSTQTQQATAEN